MKIEIRQSRRNGQWRIYFIANNNRKLLTSEQYHNLSDAKSAVALIANNISNAELAIKPDVLQSEPV